MPEHVGIAHFLWRGKESTEELPKICPRLGRWGVGGSLTLSEPFLGQI